MNGDDFSAQLAEDRAKTKPEKLTTEKPGALKALLKNPLVHLIIPSLADIGTGGLLPGWTGIVVWTYISEKKSGNSPNIAEYLVIGIPAAAVDTIEWFNLTGVLYVLTLGITIPCMLALWIWRFIKHINKKPAPIRSKIKKS